MVEAGTSRSRRGESVLRGRPTEGESAGGKLLCWIGGMKESKSIGEVPKLLPNAHKGVTTIKTLFKVESCFSRKETESIEIKE